MGWGGSMQQMPQPLQPQVQPPGHLGQQVQNTQNELAELEKQIYELQKGTQQAVAPSAFPPVSNDSFTGLNRGGSFMDTDMPAFGDDESDSDSDNDWWHLPPRPSLPGSGMNSMAGSVGPGQHYAPQFGSTGPPVGGGMSMGPNAGGFGQPAFGAVNSGGQFWGGM
mmetsp:Transcript_23384/g.54677  ORF Transcript_23384/g.54677 Transcript_23384/m.54677 type:complete len:166 (+) Transcript_23384:269-766(+)